MLFLIEYDRAAGLIVTFRQFEGAQREAASTARLALEIELMDKNIEREVVLLEASSEEALRATHNRYFGDVPSIAKAGEHSVLAREPSEKPNVTLKTEPRKPK